MIGDTRIQSLTPVGCAGSWGHALDQIFGFTVVDPEGPPHRLGGVWALITDATGAMTASVVYVDALPVTWAWPSEFPIVQPRQVGTPSVPGIPGSAGFQTAWAGTGSSYSTTTGVCMIDKATSYNDGDMVQFLIASVDGSGVVTLTSYVVGMGNPPGHGAVVVGSQVQSADGKRWTVKKIDGGRYSCVSNDRTICGRAHFAPGDVSVFGPRDVLDTRVVLAG